MAKKKWVSFTFRVSITLLLLLFLFKSLSWSMLFAALAHANYAFLVLALLIGVCGVLASAYQWQGLLQAEQIYVGLVKLCKLYLIGIGFSHFLPTGMGGDVVKAYYVGRASGNYAGSASAVVMTRLTGYFGMQLVAFSTLLLFHAFFDRSIVIWAVLLSLLVGSMIGGVVLLTTLLPKIVKRTWVKHRIIASALPIGEALMATIRRPRLLGSATAVGIVFWVQSVLGYYTYAYALHINVPLYFYCIAIPIVSLVAFLPITINGFGLRESAFVSIFATVHVPIETSLLLALLMDAQVLFFGIIGGCLYLTMGGEEGMNGCPEGERQGRPYNDTAALWTHNPEALEFDDSTPTLPMMLLSSRPQPALRDVGATIMAADLRDQGGDKPRPYPARAGWDASYRVGAGLVPALEKRSSFLQDTRPKAVFGKNKRVILIKDDVGATLAVALETHNPEKKAPVAVGAGLSRQIEERYEV